MLIEGKFLVLRDKGGQGNILTYLVEDNVTGERAYLKLYNGVSPDAMEYITGMNVLKDAKVDGLLVPLEAGLTEEDPGYYMLFPEISGPTLEDYLQIDAPFPEKEALRLAEEIETAIKAMHAEGFMHLFINRRNVFYSPGKKVILKDPALTPEIYETLMEEMEGIDYSYMSPRLMDGGEADEDDDLFALGRLMEDIAARVEWAAEQNRDGYKKRADELKAVALGGDQPALMGQCESETSLENRDAESVLRLLETDQVWETENGPREQEPTLDDKMSPEEICRESMETGEALCGTTGNAFLGEAASVTEWDDGAEGYEDGDGVMADDDAGWRGAPLHIQAEGLGSHGSDPVGLPGRKSSKSRRAALVLLAAASSLALMAAAAFVGASRNTGGQQAETAVIPTAVGPERVDGGAEEVEETNQALAVDLASLRAPETETPPGGEDSGGPFESAAEDTGGAEASRPSTEGPGAGEVAAANRAPKASFTLTPSEGSSPLQVLLDASASIDPDGRIVSYSWSCGGSGISLYRVFESQVIPARVAITLTVTDDRGASSSTTRYVTLY